MKISSSACEVEAVLGLPATIREMAKIGYDGLDLAMFNVPIDPFPWADMGYCREVKAEADAAGIAIAQTHTPFPTHENNPVKDPIIYQSQVDAIKATAELGCKYAVIHPQVPGKRRYRKMEKEGWEWNIHFYSSLLPVARDYDVTICIENLWNDDPVWHVPCPTVCSTPEEHVAMIDTLNDEHIGACLDTGHAILTHVDLDEWIRALGSRLKVLHCHDVDGLRDNHFGPFTGVIDWKMVIHTLREIGYEGYFNMEANAMGGRYPAELRMDVQALLLKSARYIVNMD